MTSCSSAVLGIERFTSAYARQVYEQMIGEGIQRRSLVGEGIQSRSLELHYQNL